MLIWLNLLMLLNLRFSLLFLIKVLIPNNRNNNDKANTNNSINKLIKSTEVTGLTESGTVTLIIMYEAIETHFIEFSESERDETINSL